jgi:transposase
MIWYPPETDHGMRKRQHRVPFGFCSCEGTVPELSSLLLHPIIMQEPPTIIELDVAAVEEILRRVDAKELQADDYQTIHAVIECYAYLSNLVGNQKVSIGRLRKMLFGASTEKTAAVVGRGTEPESSASSESAAPASSDPDSPTESPLEANEAPGGEADVEADAKSDAAAATQGHGRNGADAYTGAEEIQVPHESLQAGDGCPECERGTVYQAPPGTIVRIVARAPMHATVYRLEKLRCNLCGKVFTARPPVGVGTEKYDATAGSMIALLKYGTGTPFHRLEGLQGNLGIPLPASTQWDIVHEKAQRIEPAFKELIWQAAQGDVVYHDDTKAKILERMGKRAEKALAEALREDPAKESSERTGLFTSGIVSTRPASGCPGRTIALFFSGHQHAGENLRDVLAQRAAALPKPIQMCDALSRNMPADLQTILSNCLAHGRRQFVDVVEGFPEECRHVLEALEVIYKNDKTARKKDMSPEARLHFHQAQSGPIMAELHAWLKRQIEDRLVEPNSGLGGAITYMLKHWPELTLFLRVPGAPLDNNICERALKKAILHRKNAMFYKTCQGAYVGDLYMSLIYTCELCGANPFDYLNELERHAEELSANPQDWMPWNYRLTLEGVDGSSDTAARPP